MSPPTAGEIARAAEVRALARRAIPRRTSTEAVILHHSEGPPGQSVAEIRAFHMRPIRRPLAWDTTRQGPWKPGRGWADIGYHWIISGAGAVTRGRDETLDGAHCPRWNARSIGVCLLGDFDNSDPTKPQLISAERLLREILGRMPGLRILGHREAMIMAGVDPGDRTCPGGGGLWVYDLRERLGDGPGPGPNEMYKEP